MSETNPYASPVSAPVPRKAISVLSRVAACVLWGIAAIPVFFVVLRFQQDDTVPYLTSRSASQLAQGVVFISCVFGLLTASFIAFGLASWNRSWRLALVGVALFVAWVATTATLAALNW